MSRLLIAVVSVLLLAGCSTVPEELHELNKSFILPKTNKVVFVSCYLKQANYYTDLSPVLEKDFGERPLTQIRIFDKEFERYFISAGYSISRLNNNKCEPVPNIDGLTIYIGHRTIGAPFREDIIYIDVYIQKYKDKTVYANRQYITGFKGLGPEKAAEAIALDLLKPVN